MKTPLTYYGGKQSLAKKIISLFPKHHLYCEPFAGGLAVLFAKEKSAVEVINDKDWRVVNFFKVLKTKFPELKQLIDETPYSREIFDKASHVLNNPLIFSDVERAWALWCSCSMGFGSMIDAAWGYARKKGSAELRLNNKRENFLPELSTRLDIVQIECRDAVKVIKSRDTETSFFYVDPPYIDSDQGHYAGYTEEKYSELLECLSGIKGKFLLSSYPSKILDEFRKRNNWKQRKFDMALSMSANKNTEGEITRKRKIEVLTSNYAFPTA